MRDNGFIRAVGRTANKLDIPVILFGSTLAHAYYILRDEGCTVVTPSERARKRTRKKRSFGKLVRDGVPGRIGSKREVANVRKANHQEREGLLVGKLIEEVLEVRVAKEPTGIVEELGDVFEVLRALVESCGSSMPSVVQAAEVKRADMGGFDQGLVLHETTIPVGHGGMSRGEAGMDPKAEIGGGEGGRREFGLPTVQKQENCVEVPLSFFGFAELGRYWHGRLEELGVEVSVVLLKDRVEIRISRSPEQADLPLN